MPASYEKEALKAQAVCARTYAYRQIQGNAYGQYGAHVDDSTNFQVYNNISTSERTDQAVNETCGQMLFYNDKPIEAFYYSTSCGHGADGSVWGNEGRLCPTCVPCRSKKGARELTMEDNDTFDDYIRSKTLLLMMLLILCSAGMWILKPVSFPHRSRSGKCNRCKCSIQRFRRHCF